MSFVSIFNDVMGPVMRGPSSSHTAGAYRIACLVRSLAGENPKSIRCSFDSDGSYAPTYLPLGVDLAFAAGILGWEMTDPRYQDALKKALESGVDIKFDVRRLEHADHPNAIRIDMELKSGERLTVWAKSTGGGALELYRFNEWEVNIDGKSWDILILAETLKADKLRTKMQELLSRYGTFARKTSGAEAFLHLKSSSPVTEDSVEELLKAPGVRRLWTALPAFFLQAGPEMFSSAQEMLDIAAAKGWTLGETALAYEAQLLGRAEEAMKEEMIRRYSVMRAAVQQGCDDKTVSMPCTRPSASRILQAERRGALALGGVQTRAAVRAMACMHACNSKAVVCAAPTGGSAGVIPGVLVTLEEERKLSTADVSRALFAASAVGLIVAERATFAAEIAGCQVEIGVAGAMAAALVVEVAGGSPKQALDAAAIALQNTMGSVCDPVGGGCEIPCHTRNAAAASQAFTCADLIIGGYENPIGLDETIDASYAVGKSLPRELRCTALGGIAVTPSARALVNKEVRKKKLSHL